jgi:glycosyltransferase involved in cell wall biosynthesis
MRVGIDVTPLQSGHALRGIGTYARGLLRGLHDLATTDEFSLFAWNEALNSDVVVPRDALYRTFWKPRLGRLSAVIAQQLSLLQPLRSARLDVFHHLGVVANVEAGGPPALSRVPLVVTIHDITPLLEPDVFLKGKRIRHLIYKAMLSRALRAEAIIVDSESTKVDLVTRVGARRDRIAVIPLGVDSEFRRSQVPTSIRGGAAPFLLQVGGELPNKGFPAVLRVYEALVHKFDVPHSLVVVGSAGPLSSELRERSPDLFARISWKSDISIHQLARLYQNASCVLALSTHEGFGLPILEAMSSGAPVVASNISCFVEVGGDAARFVSLADPLAAVSAVLEVISSDQLRTDMVTKGVMHASQFTWSRTAAMTRDVYAGVSH